MPDNVLIAIIAASAVGVTAFCVLGGGIFVLVASNKRLDKIETTLTTIQADMKEFYRLHFQLEAKVDKK